MSNQKKNQYVDAETWQAKTAGIQKREKLDPGYKNLDWDREGNLESRETGGGKDKGTIVLFFGVISGLLLVGVIVALKSGASNDSKLLENTTLVNDEVSEVDGLLKEREELVDAFLNEVNPQKRLAFVRDANGVKERMKSYSKEALEMSALSTVPMGLYKLEGNKVFRYAVRFKGGSKRLLNILKTEDGFKVDWDSYARYGTASWNDLRNGKVDDAEVRAIVSEANYYNPPFGDSDKWRCYRMNNPDLDGWLYVYAEKNGKEDVKLQQWIGGNRKTDSKEVVENTGKLPLGRWYQDHSSSDLKLSVKKKIIKKLAVLRIKMHTNSYGEVLYSLEEMVTKGWVK